MYISELNIHGFKSFAKKETLKFGEGVTVIVGPNGCGKTNIVDAIRWVLGEQKYSVLRSGKMGDVIFNGAENLKPLSVCEAFLTVHNNRGKLPVEYNDVEIGRRIYRNGESEYFINRTPCRLKDIQDLFIDTGMGSDAYSVIELKMIEEILSETADDRKRMFEEAAGINKYKQQRKSTLRKFDAVGQDLERINDIVQEVEQKVQGLNLQLKRFKRHEKLNEELKGKEIGLAFIKIHDQESQIAPLRKEVEEFLHLKDEKTSDTNIHEKKLNHLKELYNEQQSELQSIQKALRSLEVDRELAQNNILVWSEKDIAAEININRLNHESLSSDDKKRVLSNQISISDKEIDDLEPQVESSLKKYKSSKSDYLIIEKNYKDSQGDLELAQSKRWDSQRKITEDRSLLDRTLELKIEKSEVLAQLKVKINKTKIEQEGYSKAQKKFEVNKIELSNSLDKAHLEFKNLRSSLIENQEKQSDLGMEINGHHSSLDSMNSQLSFYKELVLQKEGYPSGVRAVLENPENNQGIIGTVGELFQMEDKYTLAFQTALGDWAKCLVAKDRKIAIKTISSAQENKIGNLSILPLKELNELVKANQKIPKGDDILGTGIALSGVSEPYLGLANVLLGDLLIVENLEKAFMSHDLQGWNVVDLEGNYSGLNYLLKHSGKDNEGGLLGRNKKIDFIKDKIDELKVHLKKKSESSKSLNQLIGEQSSTTELLKQKHKNYSEDLNKIENNLIRNHYKQSQNIESEKSLNQEISTIKISLEDIYMAEKKLLSGLIKSEKLFQELKNTVDKSSNILVRMQVERDSFQNAVQNIRIKLLNFENARDNLNFQKQVAKETIEELNKRQKIIKTEILDLDSERNSLADQIVNSEIKLKSVSGKLVRDRSILELKQETVNDTYHSMEQMQNQIRNEQHSREVLLEELKSNELKIVEKEQRIILIRERIKDRYNMVVPLDLIVDDDLDSLELRVEQIMRSIEGIGPINMAVQDEYEDEQKRLKTLLEQRVDLTASEGNLRETIQEIDRVARKKFQDTFDQIKLNFSKLFGMFFEGGTASLSLVGDPDPLESDISIHAQPPGKKNQSLRMLSAGEKSLTAIALLFAIYQYKPSPYCILDEVDAPLDDVNIQKFKRVLNSFVDETQFIVVTHNKLTMEVADYLYGVTMEQKGVSKLVSVKFDGKL